MRAFDDGPDSRHAWFRLIVSLALSTVGGIGLWSVVVALPAIEAEFAVDRGDAALPYTATMVGFAVGGVVMGRIADRFGIRVVLLLAATMLLLGYAAASQAQSLWQFALAQAVAIGMFGSSVTFGPLVADVSLWFARRRGLAVAIVASGNYLAGTIWPPLLQFAIQEIGWRQAHLGIGIVCFIVMVPLALLLSRPAPAQAEDIALGGGRTAASSLPPRTVQMLLLLAGLGCCIAMSMPQVHIVAYCADLGYGPARGAEMLSLMLGFGVISRLASGLIADRIGALATLILGSSLQCLALMLYLPFDGLTPLFIVSALFGLSQGGIVPSYALIVRDHFPAREAGTRIGLVMMATVVGMAIGGWASGEIYDVTGSYAAAFWNGIAWNLVNMSIAFWLLFDHRRVRARLLV